jgi:hypothetical protein
MAATVQCLRTDASDFTCRATAYRVRGYLYADGQRLVRWSTADCLGTGKGLETWVPEGTEAEPFLFYSIAR